MSEFAEAAENVAAKASETNSTNVDGLEDKAKETKVNEKGDGTPNPNDIPDAPKAQDSYDGHDATDDNSEADAPSEDDIKDETEKQNEGLSDAEKQQIKEETGWSDEIINHIDSMEQYEIYKKAGLHEEVVNGRPCLVKDIDWDYVDPKTGKTNRELAAEGRSPIDSKTGEKIELHHMGQDQMVHSLNCLRTLNMAMVMTGLSTPMAEKVGDMNPVQSRSIIKNEQNIGKVAQKEATNYERFQGIY